PGMGGSYSLIKSFQGKIDQSLGIYDQLTENRKHPEPVPAFWCVYWISLKKGKTGPPKTFILEMSVALAGYFFSPIVASVNYILLLKKVDVPFTKIWLWKMPLAFVLLIFFRGFFSSHGKLCQTMIKNLNMLFKPIFSRSANKVFLRMTSTFFFQETPKTLRYFHMLVNLSRSMR
ncbi:hypothetical protein, partial [uncultured Akkermansia sp.]|uniref:hypothetical protein n=1 Tax=uncultured Akkermansia sp. TaxID=512294 RepID=UPI00265CA83C